MVLLTGSVENIAGGPVSDFVLTAKPARPFWSGKFLIPIAGLQFRPASGGELEFYLNETETNQQLISFSATYTSLGVTEELLFAPCFIPNAASADLSSLLNPVL